MTSIGSTSDSTELSKSELDLTNTSYLGRLAERLSALIEDQTEDLFERHGIVIPVRSCSLLEATAKLGPASTADLANALGQSHQLIAQKTPKLMKLRLISQSKDASDARRKVFRVTKKGEAQLQALADCTALLHQAYSELFSEVGDVARVIRDATAALEDRPIIARIDSLK